MTINAMLQFQQSPQSMLTQKTVRISSLDLHANTQLVRRRTKFLFIFIDCQNLIIFFGLFFFSWHFPASVSRISKYFYNEGLNVITAGAYTFDFERPKKTCAAEFYMLQRVGMLSFERISEFMSDLMIHFNCKRSH